jgi:hypothetical protein
MVSAYVNHVRTYLLTWDTWGGVSRSPRRRVVDTYGLLCGPPLRNCPNSGSSFGFPLVILQKLSIPFL